MNIEHAKCIPMSTILERINSFPNKQDEKEAWYFSPFREEKTASFHINNSKNVWFDFGDGKGGDTVEFVCTYLRKHGEDSTVPDALRWLSNMAPMPFKPNPPAKVKAEKPKWKLLKAVELQDLALSRYLQKRGISLPLAKQHLKKVEVEHVENKSRMYALGFRNEDGGYELRNPFLKSCVAPKTISFIRGQTIKPDGVHLFEGFIDYLTYLTISEGRQDDDAIILNSTSCVAQALSYIKGYGYSFAYTWMDNDVAGTKATAELAAFFKNEQGLLHKPMNEVYKPCKDLNAWHMDNLNLSL
ncbi:toprim domain-containing protein [Mucilaginibacter pedocola]|uniref:Zinc finger CHC2-type domain-containing protein n=1 Tax=Mucilaginibacter pedocola TaxID=1792845 RepID=A0A1S9P8S1_9SPHI|nr:toprim domain-containing protein [Mucilaginibacter pedocola]OOQ57370.1 hypothetical protein BC343_14810 [Mucilaginibacter pedocola]